MVACVCHESCLTEELGIQLWNKGKNGVLLQLRAVMKTSEDIHLRQKRPSAPVLLYRGLLMAVKTSSAEVLLCQRGRSGCTFGSATSGLAFIVHWISIPRLTCVSKLVNFKNILKCRLTIFNRSWRVRVVLSAFEVLIDSPHVYTWAITNYYLAFWKDHERHTLP